MAQSSPPIAAGRPGVHLRYRPEIDGLRAVAVVPVMLFHAHVPYFTGGFVGVDVFFVISGYLITSILMEEPETGGRALLRFYERRVRRIIPALVCVLIFCSIAAALIVLPAEYAAFCQSLVATVLFSSNILFWRDAGRYFDLPSETKPLLHTWSLAVEEQFYIAFPILIIGLKRFGNRVVAAVVTGLLIVSLLLSAYAVRHMPAAAFYLAPSRAWELLLGSVVALGVFPNFQNKVYQSLSGLVGLALIFWGIFGFDSLTPFPGENAAVPCLGAALFLAGQGGIGRRTLSVPPIVFIGLISYSLYLWHWPILVFLRYALMARQFTLLQTSAIILTTVIFAALCWHFVERPFRNLKGPISRPRLFASATVSAGLLLVVGLSGYLSAGWPTRFPDYVELPSPTFLPEYNVGTCFLMETQTSEWQADPCRLSNAHPTEALLWGDSFAAHLAPGFKNNSDELAADVLQYTASACPPVDGYIKFGRCVDFQTKGYEIIQSRKISTVILAARWHFYPNILDKLPETVRRLTSMGVKVVVIGQSPAFAFGNLNDVLYRTRSMKDRLNLYANLSFDPDINDLIKRGLPNVAVIDPLRFLCTPTSCGLGSDKQMLYIDNGHFSVFGSAYAVRTMAPDLNRGFAATPAVR